MSENKKRDSLFSQPLHVLNIGLKSFSEDLLNNNVKVLHVDWSPPAGGDPELAELLSKLGS